MPFELDALSASENQNITIRAKHTQCWFWHQSPVLVRIKKRGGIVASSQEQSIGREKKAFFHSAL
jgi:hypothetical protein